MPDALNPTSNETPFWEGRYLDGDTPWNKGAAAPPLIEYLSKNLVRGSVCVPGCGLGYDVRALAAQGADVKGLDIAPSALKQAKSFIQVKDEVYLQADFFKLPQRLHGTFDWIFEHTCFCAIDPSQRNDYVKSCFSALKPGGLLLAIFFMNPDTEPDEGPPFGVSEEELAGLFSSDFEILEDVVPTRSYPAREGRERLRLLKRSL